MKVEQILEMNADHQITIPASMIDSMNLGPGSHFTAREEGGRLIIEYLPFSSLEQGKSLEETVHSLQKE
jgi:hypothetical protein